MAKEKKQNRPYLKSRTVFNIIADSSVAKDTYISNNFVGNGNFSYSAMQEGIDWFEAGNTLEELDKLDEYNELYQKLKDNFFKKDFITGYNIAKRKKLVVDMQKKSGADFYNSGGIIELLTEEQKKKMLNDNFMLGYEEARVASWKNSQENSKKTR